VESAGIPVALYSMQGIVSLLQLRCLVDASFRQILIDQGIVSTLTVVACHSSSPSFSARDDLFKFQGVLGDSVLL
jgi:hypothetical protein